jgi:trans-aconitate methyltransferase
LSVADRIAGADDYLAARTGKYEWRCVRYDAALEVMHHEGLDDDCTVVDVGSGWGEFGVRLHTGRSKFDLELERWGPWVASIAPSRARYIPVDAALDGTDLETWTPPRPADWFVALELIEHLDNPGRLINNMIMKARRGVILSTPNPATVDVLGMDATHRTPVGRHRLEALGFRVEERSFYGKPADSLFAVWTPS